MEASQFDVIVIGSGIGGLAAAGALARRGRRVLLLERQPVAGGLTQTFRRGDYTFATGVHYIGGVGDGPGRTNTLGRLLAWLTDGRLRFAPLGSPYDVVRLPGLEVPVEAPRDAYADRLKSFFPRAASAIDRYFAACEEAMQAATTLFTAQASPRPLGALLRWANRARIRAALDTTTAEQIARVGDPRLAAVLAARWGDYGVPPARSPFAVHALVTASYFDGAYHPAGGPGRFAETLLATLQAAGGTLRTNAAVTEIRVASGRVAGVRLASGEAVSAPVVVSAMGAHATVAALPPGIAADWCRDVRALRPGLGGVVLYVGLRGDIRAHGATPANLWIYESDDIGRVWERPGDEDAPALFVSFTSLKDPAHPNPQRHCAEVVALCRREAFEHWSGSAHGARPEDYEATKARIGETLLAQFRRHFPRLAPLVDCHEVSTPLSQAFHVGTTQGAMYGIEMSAERMRQSTLGVRTPVPGLFLAGQDAASPGIAGAFMGGWMAAAAIDPGLWRKMSP